MTTFITHTYTHQFHRHLPGSPLAPKFSVFSHPYPEASSKDETRHTHMVLWAVSQPHILSHQ